MDHVAFFYSINKIKIINVLFNNIPVTPPEHFVFKPSCKRVGALLSLLPRMPFPIPVPTSFLSLHVYEAFTPTPSVDTPPFASQPSLFAGQEIKHL